MNKRFQILIYFIICFCLMGISLFQLPAFSEYKQKVNYYFLANKYEKLAKNLPYGDSKAKRYRAIADSLRKNSLDYRFESGLIPSAN